MASTSFPEVSDALIARLLDAFPDAAPRTNRGEFVYGMLAGQMAVIDLLKTHNMRQQEKHSNVPNA